MSEVEDDYESAKENFPQDTERLVTEEEGGQDTETDACDEENSLSPQETRYKSCWRRSFVYISCIIASIGGILFGYDIGIIAGALSQLTEEFCLTDIEKEIVVSSLLLGAFLASLIAGFIIDQIGRRICIIINAVLFIIGAALLAASVVFPMLIIGRLIVGFAVSMSIVAEIAYIAEVSPPKIRGLLIAWNELAIVSGFLLAYIVNLAFVAIPFGWRIMFGLSILPAAVQGCLLFFIPNSPRYLVMKGEKDKAAKVLKRLRAGADIEKEISEIEDGIEQSRKHRVFEIFLPRDNMIFRFIVGAGLCVFQKFTGQPAVLYYAPLLFKRLGIPGDLAADMATVGLGIAKFIAILVCVLTVDRFGRRRYLLLGTFVMSGALTLVGVVAIATPAIVALHKTTPPVCGLSSVVNDSTGMNVSVNVTTAPMSEDGVPIVAVIAVVIGLLFFIAGYELSYGAVTWIILGEIFPAEIRGRAISIATSLNWLANIVVAVSMLSLLDALHGYSYILYAFFTFAGFVFILLMVPETKGKSLEQLSRELSVRNFFSPLVSLKQRIQNQLSCLKTRTTVYI